MPIYSFQCTVCGVDQEKLVKLDERDSPHKCDCGGLLKRGIDTPHVKLDPVSGDFPGATMSWEKRRKQQLDIENKALAEHGSLNGKYNDQNS